MPSLLHTPFLCPHRKKKAEKQSTGQLIPHTYSSRRSSSALLAIALLACLGAYHCTSLSRRSDSGGSLSGVLHDAAGDTINTFRSSETPIKDMLAKHTDSLQKFGLSTVAGYMIGNLFKFFAMGMIKATFISGLALSLAIWGGLVNGQQLEALAKRAGVLDTTRVEREAKKTLDVNRDGKVDLMDFGALLKRAEDALLRTNLPSSFGGITGVFLSVLLWR